MLTHDALLALARRQDGSHTLSAYISVPADEQAPVAAARMLLRRGIARARAGLAAASHTERAAFDGCAARLVACAERHVHHQGGGTWVGFASADGTSYDEAIPAIIPVSVVWEDRMRIVPYLAAFDDRPALMVMVDREHARLYRCALGVLSELERFETRAPRGSGSHMGAPPHQSFHPGTRGETAETSAQHQAESASHRHVARIVSRVAELDAADAWVIVGGASGAVTQVVAALPHTIAARLGVAGGVQLSSPPAQVRTAAESAVRALETDRRDRIVADLLARAHGAALDALGFEAAKAGLVQRAVASLVMTTRWTEENAIEAEAMVRAVVAQGGKVEIAHAHMQMESQAGGVGARLRHTLKLTSDD